MLRRLTEDSIIVVSLERVTIRNMSVAKLIWALLDYRTWSHLLIITHFDIDAGRYMFFEARGFVHS